MKKLLSLLLCLSLLPTVLTGCQTGVSVEEYNQVVAERDRLAGILANGGDLVPDDDSALKDESNETSQSDAPKLGDRKNPIPLNSEATVKYERYDSDIGYSIKISELLRGEEAEKVALEKNKFNEIPQDKDLILFKVDFKLNKFTDSDPFLCSGIYFDYYSGTYAENSTFVSISGLEDLHASLYEGAATSGWLYTVADKDDKTPLTVFDETIWLALY